MTVLNFRGRVKQATIKASKTGPVHALVVEAHLSREQVTVLNDWIDEWASFTVDEVQVGQTPMKAPNGQMTLDEAIRPEGEAGSAAPAGHATLSNALECSEPSEWEIKAQRQSTADEPNPPVHTLHACTYHAEQALIEARAYAGEFGMAERRMLETGETSLPCFYGRMALSDQEILEQASDEEIAEAGATMTDSEVAEAEAEDATYQGDGSPETYEGDVPEEDSDALAGESVLVVEGEESHEGPITGYAVDGEAWSKEVNRPKTPEEEASAADGLSVVDKYHLCVCGHNRMMHTEHADGTYGDCMSCTCPTFRDVDSVIMPDTASEPEPKTAKRGTRKHQRELLGLHDPAEVD